MRLLVKLQQKTLQSEITVLKYIFQHFYAEEAQTLAEHQLPMYTPEQEYINMLIQSYIDSHTYLALKIHFVLKFCVCRLK
jgi:hypothetical protein